MKLKAADDGYSRIPIYGIAVLNKPNWEDNIDPLSCKYVLEAKQKLWDDTAYGDAH